MKIIFYENYADDNIIDKTAYLNEVFVGRGTLRSSVNILTPVVRVECEETPLDIKTPTFNYAYIYEFNKYYYITSYDIVRYDSKMIIDVYFSIDVLHTYKDVLKTLPLYYKRYSREDKVKSNVLVDNELPLQLKPQIDWFYGTDGDLTDAPYSRNDKTFQNILVITSACVGNSEYSIYKYGTIDEDTSNNTYFSRPNAMNKYTYDKFMQILLRGSIDTLFNLFSNPLENIAGVFYCPFNVRNIWIRSITDNQVADAKFAFIGNARIDLTEGETDLTKIQNAFIFQNRLWEIDGGTITIPKPSNSSDFDIYSFLNYNPYATLDLFIPFYGWVTVDPKFFVGSIIKLTYVWDMYTGQATAYLYKNNEDYKTKPLYSFDVNLCSQLPLGSGNYGEIRRNIIMTAMKAYSTYVDISSAKNISTIKAPKKYTPRRGTITKAYDKYSSVEKEKMTSAITGAITDNTCSLINGSVLHTSVGEVTQGWNGFAVTKMIARITRPKPIYNKSYVVKYFGYPAVYECPISELPSGLLIVDTAHLEGLSCTQDEREQINELLTSGVLWFNKVDSDFVVIDSLGNLVNITMIRFNSIGTVDVINNYLSINDVDDYGYFTTVFIKIKTPKYITMEIRADDDKMNLIIDEKETFSDYMITTLHFRWYNPPASRTLRMILTLS